MLSRRAPRPLVRSTNVRALALATVAMPLFAGAAMAQDQDASIATATEVEEVTVVVGAMTDVVLRRDEIELIQANDLADLFRQTPSVEVGGSLGIAQKIYVRGLEDSLLNVTIDGAPQRGTLFHHIGRVSIEPELIETVEVQAGAGEATAGFGAIGGAIRFRTRDPISLLADGQNFGGIVRGSWFSNDGYKLSATGYGRLFGDVGFVASFVYVDRDDMEDGNGDTIRATAAEQQLGFLKVGGDLGGGHRFSVSYEQRNEEASFGQRPNWPVLVGDLLFPAEAERRTLVGNYGFNPGGAYSIEAAAYWTQSEFVQDRYDAWGRYGAEIETWGFDLRGRYEVGAHRFVAGVEYRNDRVNSRYLAPAAQWQPHAWDPAIGSFTEEGELWGLYAQDHWQVTDSLLLSFGVRWDSYDLDRVTYNDGVKSDGFSFNIGANWELIEGLTFNIGYAEAFRGKEIGDAFTLEQRPGRLVLSPTLKPEQVGNFETGLSWSRNGFRASIAYFDMAIDDVVLDQLGRGPFPQDSFYYENVGKFESSGFELRAGYSWDAFSVDAYYNHYDSRLNGNRIEGYEHIALGNSLGDNWNITGTWTPSSQLSFQASLTRYEDLDNIEVLFREVELGWIGTTQFIDKPGYTVVDLFARWQPFANRNFELLGAVYNLFDEQYISHASVADYSSIPGYGIVQGLPEAGRNIRITASFKF